MYQLNGSANWALTSTGRRLDLPTSGLALLRDRDHWRLLRSEWGDGAGEVKGVAFTANSKNPARMVCNRRFWLVGWLRVRKGSGFSRHRDMTIPLVGQFRSPRTCVMRLAGICVTPETIHISQDFSALSGDGGMGQGTTFESLAHGPITTPRESQTREGARIG